MSTALRTYYRGANLVSLREHPTGQTRYYHSDYQGTTQCLTDSAGTVTDRFACDAWGVEVKRTGSSLNRQWYIGNWGYYRQVDQALDYVRARWLVTSLGIWLSVDPLFTGETYRYVTNRPSSLTDPSGLVPRKLSDIKCPDACGGCVNAGELLVVQETLGLGGKADLERSRGVHVGFGWKVSDEDAKKCSCAGGMRWVQLVRTNVADKASWDNIWRVDDNRRYEGLGSKEFPYLRNCEFLAYTDMNQRSKKMGFYPLFQPYRHWMQDTPSKSYQMISDFGARPDERGKIPEKKIMTSEFIACPVCHNYKSKGINWVMVESCVYWGYAAEVTKMGVVGWEVWYPRPKLIVGKEKAYMMQVLSHPQTGVGPANCPDNPVKRWVLSDCPPST